MPITRSELQDIIEIDVSIEKLTSLSSDGKNLLTRIPKEIKDFLKIKKGNKMRWKVSIDGKINVEVIK